ncbi:hypothetical protein GCM10025880_28060 [Methylorubrum aminovorans]|nr:hypothetical protein GCM10025880_28060 [Methylorubrum aminovorans]
MVPTGYNAALVALSVAIAVLASYTALDLGGRMRGTGSRARWAWLIGAALAMGGGIWSMHFVGMLAFEMGLPAAYDFGSTLLSLLIAIGVTGAALAWLGRGEAGRWDVLVAGPVMGIGVAAMHYTGMAAMRMPGNLAYSPPIVALSVGIAVVAATVALWLTFRPTGVWQRFVAALVMGLAVAGMHYTGMAAATITAGKPASIPPISPPRASISRTSPCPSRASPSSSCSSPCSPRRSTSSGSKANCGRARNAFGPPSKPFAAFCGPMIRRGE